MPERLATWPQLGSPLAMAQRTAIAAPMKIPASMLAAAALLLSAPAEAIVGSAPSSSSDGVGRSVVTIIGSRGNFCTGSLIAPTLVLTVAHCVEPGAVYKIVLYGADQTPELQDVKTVAVHPGFKMAEMLAHRATADVALLQLEIPAKGKSPSRIGIPQFPIAVGAGFTIAGIGVTRSRRWQEWRHHPHRRPRCHRQAWDVANPPGRSADARGAQRARRLYRRFRRAGVRGSRGGPDDYRRHQLVDRAAGQRRLRRSDWRDAAHALPRLDIEDRAAVGFRTVKFAIVIDGNQFCLARRWVDRGGRLRQQIQLAWRRSSRTKNTQ